MRKLPVYLLIDCSGSMDGGPMDAVWNSVEELRNSLLGNPETVETARLSVITFANEAKETVPLTDLLSFQPPRVEADGFTAMGAALELLAACVERDVQKKSDTERGDYLPLVFLFTDGQDGQRPNAPDKVDFHAAARRIRAMHWGGFVACAGGHHVNIDSLREITDTVIQITQLTPEMLSSFFHLVSDSIGNSVALAAPAPLPSVLPVGYVDLRKPVRTS